MHSAGHTLNGRDGGHWYCYTNSCPLGSEPRAPLKVTEQEPAAAARPVPRHSHFPFPHSATILPPGSPCLPTIVSPTDSRNQSKYLSRQWCLSVLVLFFIIAVQLLEKCSKEREKTPDL